MKRFEDYIGFKVDEGDNLIFQLTPPLLRGIQNAFNDLATEVEKLREERSRCVFDCNREAGHTGGHSGVIEKS